MTQIKKLATHLRVDAIRRRKINDDKVWTLIISVRRSSYKTCHSVSLSWSHSSIKDLFLPQDFIDFIKNARALSFFLIHKNNLAW